MASKGILVSFVFILIGLAAVLGIVQYVASMPHRIPDAPGVADQQQKHQNPLVVYQVSTLGIKELTPSAACRDDVLKSAALLVKPGRYCIMGNQYAFATGGVRIYRYPDTFRYFIVQDENLPNLLSAIAWAISHGNRDDGLPVSALVDKARYEKLSLTCGNVANVSLYLLRAAGYRARMAAGLTLEPWNDYYNGHTLFEVQDKQTKRWILADLDSNVLFADQDQKLMSYRDIYQDLQDGHLNATLDFIATDSLVDVSGFKMADERNMSFITEHILATPDVLLQRYEKIFQVVLLKPECCDRYYFLSPSSQFTQRVLSYSKSYQPLSEAAFVKKFYSNKPD